MNKPDHRGLSHILNATRYSMQGLRAAFRHEEAFRLELLAASLFLPLGLLLGQSGVERALLAGSILLVLIVELINSAVEAVVDRVGVETHPLSGRAKDIGSAAVLVALLNVAVVWVSILYPRFF